MTVMVVVKPEVKLTLLSMTTVKINSIETVI